MTTPNVKSSMDNVILHCPKCGELANHIYVDFLSTWICIFCEFMWISGKEITSCGLLDTTITSESIMN